jgi:dihydrofolate synthase/folylpolyglutamate synthase
MTYPETVDYLFSQLPMYSKIGAAAYKEDLHNSIAICNALDNPQNKFKSIHIAGTNGKGSTTHMLAAILQEAGYKTGLYTSPHLKDFRERIKINGTMVSESFVIDFVKRTNSLVEQIQPSFFELTMAMAFDYFAQEAVDIAIIETGLGGRLDSTNIITPILSVITNIGFDHMNILGDTLVKIAGEKAGIIKQSVPVVIGEYSEETKRVFETKAAECNAPIHFAQEEYSIVDYKHSLRQLDCSVFDKEKNEKIFYSLDLNGLYQLKNLLTILATEKELQKQGFFIPLETKKNALANVKKLTGLHGRWELIADNPFIVLDVAHNEDGMKQILSQTNIFLEANDDGTSKNKLHFILGMAKDKELSKVLNLMPRDANYYFTAAHIPRAIPSIELMMKAAEYGLPGLHFDNVNDAIEEAKKRALQNDLIVVCGSVFLVGEVNQQLI